MARTRRRRSRSRRRSFFWYAPRQAFGLIAVALIVVVGVVIAAITAWPLYLIWLAAAGLVTFAIYGFDKARAKAGGTRVPEAILHGLALAGGFVGGWAGRAFFRHKTRKWSFAFWLAVSTAIHLVVIYMLFWR